MIVVRSDQLRPETLQALIEEFVTRDGAVQGHIETPLGQRVGEVRRQLDAGTVQIVFSEASETWTILPTDLRAETHRAVDE